MHEHRSKTTGWLSKVARYCGCCLVVLLGLGAPKGLGQEMDIPSEGHCLASVVYYEARGEPLRGQRAVLDVVLNRAYKSGKSVCEILTAKGQFQWTKRKPMLYTEEMAEQLDVVGQHPKVLKNEIYFFATHVRPSWSGKMQCRTIAKHTFCKEKQ